jgi:large repetitive protein
LQKILAKEFFTDEQGYFEIQGNGTLRAHYEGPFLSGISTYDLVLISRHILGQESLKSEFQKIAADVNGSGSISTLDMIELRKVILGINHDFGTVPSWQILKRNGGNDFIAIKTGDVNHSAFDDIPVVSRSRIDLKIEDKFFKEKETFEVKIPLKDVFDFSGGQVGLEFDPKKLKLKNIFSTVFWHLGKDGILRMLWTKEDLADQEITLELESLAKSHLSESVRLSRKFESQGYGSEGEIIPIDIEWKQEEKDVRFFPNPFSEFTEIDLTGFSSSRWVMEVYNGMGVKILEKSNLGGVVKISRKELGSAGVFWAVLRGGDKEILSFKILHTHD